jgi:hypothetical protein
MTPRSDRIPFARNDPSSVARSHGANLFVRFVTACLLQRDRQQTLEDTFQQYWSRDDARELQVLSRAIFEKPKQNLQPLYVERAAVTTPLTAAASALTQTTSREFLLNLGPASAGSTLMRRCLFFEFDRNFGAVRVPAVVVASSGSAFVQEGSPLTVEQPALTGATLSLFTLASISAFTRETLRLTLPSLETMVRVILMESVGLKLDAVMFSTAAAVTNVSPAGLLVGLSAATPSTASPLRESLAQDVALLASNVAVVAGAGPIIFIASPRQAVALKLFFGSDGAYDVLPSAALADKTVLCIGLNCLAAAIGPAVDLQIATQTGLHMEDTAALPLATGTGPTVASPIRSLYQTDTMAAKLHFDCCWALRHSSGLSFMTNVSW